MRKHNYGLSRKILSTASVKRTAPAPVATPEPVFETKGERTARRVIAAYQAGHSIYEVARAENISPNYVWSILKRAGIKTRGKKGRQPSEEDLALRAKLIAEYNEGATPKELMKKYDKTYHQVYFALRMGGAVMRSRGWAGGSRKIDRDMQITEEYLSGGTSVSLSEKYGITRERICQVLRKTNAISTKHERDKMAREAIRSEAWRAKAEARAYLDERIAKGLEMVRNGSSARQATMALGLPNHVMLLACKEAGIKSKWGRHRDYSAKIELIRRERGKNPPTPYARINQMLFAMGERKVNAQFMETYCPDLIRRMNRQAPTVPPVRQRVLSGRFDWSASEDERVMALWMAGHSAMEISLRMNRSRNSVLGRLFRLKEEGLFNDAGRVGSEGSAATGNDKERGGVDQLLRREDTGAAVHAGSHAEVADAGEGGVGRGDQNALVGAGDANESGC